MTSPLADVELHGELPSLVDPVLIVSLKGWIDAAEAADEAPRASMMAAPRLATVGMYVSAYHA